MLIINKYIKTFKKLDKKKHYDIILAMNGLDQITKNILKDLSPRACDVISRRFGVGKYKNRETLEAIGQDYSITRERVRQIEAAALNKIRTTHKDILNEVSEYINQEITSRGFVVSEPNLLDVLSTGEGDRNCFYLFLNLGEEFKKLREDEHFNQRWINDQKRADSMHAIMRDFHKNISKDALMSEDKIVARLASDISLDTSLGGLSKDAFLSLLNMSRKIGSNKIGEWGLASSSQISPRGVRDLAHLVLRRQGEPMHFTEIAETIQSSLGEHAHVQTVHNELIKDTEFVLVGRGLYALISMGYKEGVVSDIIKQVIEDKGPMTKDEIIGAVLKERHVKESTVLINLQNKKYFKKLTNNTYILV